MKSITFYEYDGFLNDTVISTNIDELPLTPSELKSFINLASSDESILSKMFSLKGFTIKATHFVGAIKFENIQIIILPKISKSKTGEFELGNINFMLEKAYGLMSRFSSNIVSLDSAKGDLMEYQIDYFAESLMGEIKRGVYKEFTQEESEKRFLKGRLNIPKTIRLNMAGKKTFNTNSVVFSENNTFNGLLKWACKELVSLTSNSRIKSKLFFCLDTFVEVNDLTPNTHTFSSIQFNRNNERFRELINLAKLVYDGEQLILTAGNTTIRGIVFDMNKLFEKFIFSAISESLPKIVSVKDQQSFLLAKEAKINHGIYIQPDLVLSYLDKLVVIDTKYKIISLAQKEAFISNADIYQLSCYRNYFKNKFKHVRSILVYPKYDDEVNLRYDEINENESFYVLSFSLSGDLRDSYREICESFIVNIANFLLPKTQVKDQSPEINV
ncbi:MAG: McrC family protein [Bacteriovoracaceae bacterium]|nr:McrC family protein [Bacteriovoracaceae bacterium]